ncbi:hypothetical protein Emag_001282 [Eimeria magna]
MGSLSKVEALPELYPQCVSLRKELDALLGTLTNSSTPGHVAAAGGGGESSSGCGFGVTSQRSQARGEKDVRGTMSASVAKLQRFSALTRQFCMLVLKLQEAFAGAKTGGRLPKNMHSLWDRRIQDLVADAESFRREAEGRMNMEQQRVEDVMRERKALLGEANIGRRWGDMRDTELMYAKERDRLQESRTMLDSVLAQGWGIVGQLVSQNTSLKNAKRKVLDMASSAGVASTLLGAVGRRQQGDKWLVYSGMIATLVFFFVVYRLVHYGNVFGFVLHVVEAEEDSSFTDAVRLGQFAKSAYKRHSSTVLTRERKNIVPEAASPMQGYGKTPPTTLPKCRGIGCFLSCVCQRQEAIVQHGSQEEVSRKTPSPSAHHVSGEVPLIGRPPVQLSSALHVDSQRGPHSSVGDLIGGPHHVHYDAAHISSGVEHISTSDHMNEAAVLSERRPTPSKRSLRLGELSHLQQSSAEAHAEADAVARKAPHTVRSEEKGATEVVGHFPSTVPLMWEGRLDYSDKALLTRSPESSPQRQSEHHSKVFEDLTDEAFEESADQRKALNLPLNFRAFSESVSIPSPLAHSLLYRTRDITNPLNLANFLAEGQEWLIPGTGSLWEGLGRRVDSLFSGLFLKTASVLPDYTRNVIICYKEYKPSMWIEMFGLRNQFLRQLASLFQGTHRMQSVYLRNLGMEIFELPPLWHVGEFIATVLKLKNYVSHVYTDHLVTDFDTEVQASIKDGIESQGISLPSGWSSGDAHQGKQHAYPSQDTVASGEARPYQVSTHEAAHHRRLEVMTNDPFTWQQWAIVDSGPSRWGIEAPTAWDVWTGHGLKPRFTVAVIDSGVDYEHPDLKNQIWRNPDEICGNGIDDDFNGFVDDCIGWDFVKGTSMPMDENGHGTASAGIIAAEPNNGIGLTGVCWGCDILVLKALNEDIKGTISAFARSLDYAIGKGVMISNNSYGGRGSGFRGLEEAVQRARQAGMIVVAAAGNYNGNNDNDKQPVFPASYDLDNVVSVAAISRNGQLAPFSSYGKRQVDVAAPGANIMTTSAKKSYRSVSGTSFAVPMVTGTLALLWTRRPQLNYRQVIHRMLRSVKKNPHLEGLIATAGTVDAWSTLANEDLLDPYAVKPVLPMTFSKPGAVRSKWRLRHQRPVPGFFYRSGCNAEVRLRLWFQALTYRKSGGCHSHGKISDELL